MVTRVTLLGALIVLFVALACTQPTPTPSVDVEATVAAQVAQTVEAGETQQGELTLEQLQALLSQLTPEADPSGTAETSEPTQTPVSTRTPTATPTKRPISTSTPVPTAAPTATVQIAIAPIVSPTPDRASIVERAARAVVFIETPLGTGSGFVFDDDGHILTNAHVVGDFQTVTVRYNDQFNFQGTVVNADAVSDLAVIKVDTRIQLEKMSLGDSGEVRPGETVNVIGFPFGTLLGSSVSIAEGVLSARREFDGIEYLQTDAVINPGNSGGPLVNIRGEVIGVNTSRLEDVAGRAAQGIGLAITSNYVQVVLPFLMEELAARPTATRTPIATVTPTPNPAVEGEWVVYRNTLHGYSVGVPPEWDFDATDPSFVVVTRESQDSFYFIAVFPSGTAGLDDLAGMAVQAQKDAVDYRYVHTETSEFWLPDGTEARLVDGRSVENGNICAADITILITADEDQTFELISVVCDSEPVSVWLEVEEVIFGFNLDVDVVYPTPIPAPTATATPMPLPTPSPTQVALYQLELDLDPPESGLIFVTPWDPELRYVGGTLVQLTASCDIGNPTWFGSEPEYGEFTDETIFVFMDRDKFVLLECK